MKRCKCEHWQTCPICYPQGFDEHGARKPVEIPSSREELQREITELREQVNKLEALVVMRCDLDVPPQFSQGLQPHEFLEPVTAEHCQWFVAEIEKLRKERDEYKSGFEAAASKYRNLKLQMQEIINVC